VVVERSAPQLLAGILALSDIVRAQARLARAGTNAAGTVPIFSEVQKTLADSRSSGACGHLAPPGPTPDRGDDLDLRYHIVLLALDAPAVGQAVRNLALPPGVLLVAIERAEQTVIPQGKQCWPAATGSRL
jgi:hypothetical protein